MSTIFESDNIAKKYEYNDNFVSSLEHGELIIDPNTTGSVVNPQAIQQLQVLQEEDYIFQDDDNQLNSVKEVEVDDEDTQYLIWQQKQQQRENVSKVIEELNASRSRYYQNSASLNINSIPRLVQRNLPFHQSRNQIQIQNYIPTGSERNYYPPSSHEQYSYYQLLKILRSDWFHVSLREPLYTTLTALLMIWTLMILLWAAIYMGVDNMNPNESCGLGPAGSPISFYGAFAFSLETCTTVGYGLPSSVNSFFESCPTLQVAIYVQMVWSMLFNAFLLSFFCAKSAQCSSRSMQVLFSNKAIVTLCRPSCPGEDAQVRFQVRVYDYDSVSPIIESHVRMYVVMKDRPVPRQLRLFIPDDEIGGMIFLSIPYIVNHHIDLYSLLHPPIPPYRPNDDSNNDSTIDDGWCEDMHSNNKLPYITTCNGLPAIRQIDSVTGNQDAVICPVCGESYGTVERWIQHVKNFTTTERIGRYPIVGSHQEISTDDSIFQYARQALKPTDSIQSIHDYFQQHVSEIIVVVEGVEPIASGTFSAVQSYMYEDIVFHEDAAFKPCIMNNNHKIINNNKWRSSKTKKSTTTIDLDLFHDVVYNTRSKK
jgi:Inward rectifier potassium channel transmembrane domain